MSESKKPAIVERLESYAIKKEEPSAAAFTEKLAAAEARRVANLSKTKVCVIRAYGVLFLSWIYCFVVFMLEFLCPYAVSMALA